ncbi:MAG: hypothetical protein AB1428_14530 [Bacteroidota bacterium]
MKNTTAKPVALIKSVKRYPGLDLLHHAAYYHAARVGYQDLISRSLHDFKDGCEPQTSRWVNLAAPLVSKELQFDIIVRALGSSEEKATAGTPLDKLCEAIARSSGAAYAPQRLEKVSAVRALTTLGGRAARQKELERAYRFDPSGLPSPVRILVVDDLATTGATLEAISSAIRDAHPEAHVVCFTLARVEAQMQNTHLDPNFFLHGSGMRSEKDTQRAVTTVRVASVGQGVGRPVTVPASKASSFARLTTRHASHAAARVTAKPLTSPDIRVQTSGKTPVPTPPKGLDTRVYVVGLLLSLMLLGATILFPAKKDQGGVAPQFVQLVAQNAIKSPDPIPERRPSTSMTAGKPGIVTVPSSGLRMNHSMASRIVPKTIVKNRERVEILRKYSSPTGPDWLQVRTKTGAVGWVVASVVKEVRG